jgi:hypothetical protein
VVALQGACVTPVSGLLLFEDAQRVGCYPGEGEGAAGFLGSGAV